MSERSDPVFKEGARRAHRDLLRWLLLIPLILLLLFSCGSVAMVSSRPVFADTRSVLNADYRPWPFVVYGPVDPDIIQETVLDQQRYPDTFVEPVLPTVIPGGFWPTPTPTPSPTPPFTATPGASPTLTLTLALTASISPSATTSPSPAPSETPSPSPTFTDTATATPSGPPPPVPPAVPPSNTYWFYDDAAPLAYMMYTASPSGTYRSSNAVAFNSPAFALGQSLAAGVTTANFYAANPSGLPAVFTIQLRAGAAVLGSGTFALPANTFAANFFSASFSTGAHDFVAGERLQLSVNLPAPAEIFWDGAYDYSGVAVPAVMVLPTATSTASATATVTRTPTASTTVAATNTPPPTATNTPVPTSTNTPVPTATDTPTPTATDTPTPSDTPTPTATSTPTPSDTPTPTASDTPLPTATDTPLPTATDTPLPTATDTPLPTATDTPLPTATDTPTPSDTPTPTATDTPTPSDTPTPTPTDTPTPSDTPTPTATDTPTPSDTPTPTATGSPTVFAACDWLYRKPITINASQVVADLTDFPVLIGMNSDADLAADAQDDGDDIVFTASDGTTQLDHEIEYFDGTTGALRAWVRIPSLSGSVDTTVYLYYGNSGTTSQQDSAGTWSNGFTEVWHLAETSGNVFDSTSNGYVGTASGSLNRSAAGQIDGADELLGPSTTTWLNLQDGDLGANEPFTLSTWFYVDTSTTWAGIVTKGRETGNDWIGLWANGTQFTFGWDWQGGKGGNVDGPALTLDTWYYGVGTFDGTNRRLYLNNALVAGPSAGFYNGLTGTDTSVGNDRLDANANSFDGTIDEVRLASSVRSLSWIQTEFNNQGSPGTFHSAPGVEESTSVICATATPTPTATDTPLPTATDTPLPTATDTPLPTATDTPLPTATDTPLPTSTPAPTPTPAAGAGKMYWTDRGLDIIRRADLDGSNMQDLVSTGLVTTYGIALDTAAGKMYWVDQGTFKIQRANLDGTGVEDLVTTGVVSPEFITLDVAAAKMYWTDSGDSTIKRANLDGTAVETLVSSGLNRPAGIELDVADGKMYWADGGSGVIQRANLDGSGVQTLVTGQGNANGIALDLVAGKVYWVSDGGNFIRRANLDGSSLQDVSPAGLASPKDIDLDVAAGKMYFTESLGPPEQIRRANLDGSSPELLVPSLGNVRGIALDP